MAMDLEDLLEELKDWLEEVESPEGVGDSTGVLAEPNLGFVLVRLARVDDHIQVLRDPSTPPTLDPANVGSVISSYAPDLSHEFADDCVTLATEAYTESRRSLPNHQYIGDRIETISALLPDFRKVAGIT